MWIVSMHAAQPDSLVTVISGLTCLTHVTSRILKGIYHCVPDHISSHCCYGKRTCLCLSRSCLDLFSGDWVMVLHNWHLWEQNSIRDRLKRDSCQCIFAVHVWEKYIVDHNTVVEDGVSNGSGQPILVRVQVENERLPNSRYVLSLNLNC